MGTKPVAHLCLGFELGDPPSLIFYLLHTLNVAGQTIHIAIILCLGLCPLIHWPCISNSVTASILSGATNPIFAQSLKFSSIVKYAPQHALIQFDYL